MPLYLSPNSVPELEGLDDAEKKRLYLATLKEGRRRLGGFAGMTRKFWWLILLAVFAAFFSRTYLPPGGMRGVVMGVVVVVIAMFLISAGIEAGREWLREQGYPKKS